MPFRILSWETQPIGPPKPIWFDDSATFDAAVVRLTREWLASTRSTFNANKPSPIRIVLQRPTPGGAIVAQAGYDVAPTHIGEDCFTHGTFTALLRHAKTKVVLAIWTFIAARHLDGRVIVGPVLAGVHQGTLDAITVASEQADPLKVAGVESWTVAENHDVSVYEQSLDVGIPSEEQFGVGGTVKHGDLPNV